MTPQPPLNPLRRWDPERIGPYTLLGRLAPVRSWGPADWSYTSPRAPIYTQRVDSRRCQRGRVRPLAGRWLP